ncbi:MAG: heavy metal translocating P-type ATPase [Candidatus Cloacimonadaceae bacterium]|jgi:Cd2+/Zn2+-exporting ATPase
MTTQEYEIHNLDCAHCANEIEAGICKMPGVAEARLDFVNRKLVVSYSEEVVDALERLNHLADSIEPGVSITDTNIEVADKRASLMFWLPLVLGVLVLIVSLALPVAPALKTILGIIAWLLVGHRVIWSALRSLFKGKVFGEQFLMTIATSGALVLGEFTEAVAVMFLYEIGEWLESLAVKRSYKSIQGMLSIKPDKAHLITAEGTKDVALSQVQVGQKVLVYPSERIPLDGVVSKGSSSLDTSTLTGEAAPLAVSEGDKVISGTLNIQGLLEIEVSSIDAESTVSRVLKLIEDAGSRKSTSERFITRFAGVYTPAVVIAAILVFLIPTLLGFEAAVWLKRSLVFLIVSCPCALVISVPLSYYVGIGKAARQGIIVKGSIYLDILRQVKTMVFDKTGTLTTGELKIKNLLTPKGGDAEELKSTVYRCEYTSHHPFAKAIKAAYSADYEAAKVSAFSEHPGKGITMEYDADRLVIGSAKYLQEHGYDDLIDVEDESCVHAGKNGIYLGAITFADELRPGMRESIARLRSKGIEQLGVLSGDRKLKVQAMSRELGLDFWEAELLPDQKIGHLERLMQASSGFTSYVGEGMNDAPALARADVGIAMGKIGNPASIETADIVLLNDRPEQLLKALEVAENTHKSVVQNISLALGVKVLVMVLGLSGVSGLWEAIIADVGVTLLAVLNAGRFGFGKSRT